jgi:hypothetical protein
MALLFALVVVLVGPSPCRRCLIDGPLWGQLPEAGLGSARPGAAQLKLAIGWQDIGAVP